MSERQEFLPEPHTVAAVRRLVAEQAGVGFSHDAVLVASELASNAVKHARTRYEVRVDAEETIRIEVIDHSEQPYNPHPSELSKGLRIVDLTSERWGVMDIKDNGKMVWAEIGR